MLTVATAQVPHVPNEERLAVQLSDAICSTSASGQGSRRTRTSPKRWSQPREQCLKRDAEDVRYFLGRETIIVTHLEGMAVWREKLSVLMARNEVAAPRTSSGYHPNAWSNSAFRSRCSDTIGRRSGKS